MSYKKNTDELNERKAKIRAELLHLRLSGADPDYYRARFAWLSQCLIYPFLDLEQPLVGKYAQVAGHSMASRDKRPTPYDLDPELWPDPDPRKEPFQPKGKKP
jgi:hypothetical protein